MKTVKKNEIYKFYSIVLILLFFPIDKAISQQECDCFKNFFLAEKIYMRETKREESIKYYRIALIDNNISDPSIYYNTFWKSYHLDSMDFCNELQSVFIQQDMTYESYKRLMAEYPNFPFKLDSILFFKATEKKQNWDLDTLLVAGLNYMVYIDQLVRENENLEQKSILNQEEISEMNYLWLKKIILLNKGKLPELHKIGYDGIDNIRTIILHSDIDQIIDLWPYLTRSIKEDKLFIGEDILYQIERNITSSPFLIQLEDGKLIKKGKNSQIPNSKLYYQNFGGMDLFDYRDRKRYWWPFNPNLNLENTNKIRKALCLDSLTDYIQRKGNIIKLSDKDFLIKFNR